MAGVLPATLRAVAAQRVLTDRLQIKQRPSLSTEPFILFDAGSSLLAWETPHYHRRYGVSLLSSAWGQVGCRATAAEQILCALYAILYRISGVACARKVSHILLYAPSFPSLAALLLRKLCVLNSESVLKIVSHPPKHLRRCKVKPHGSLVPVSSTHRCAYTPGLSTSSSSTFLQETLSLRENSSRGKFRA